MANEMNFKSMFTFVTPNPVFISVCANANAPSRVDFRD